jgi:hypothetical protein
VSGPGGACAGLVGVAVPLSGLMSSSLPKVRGRDRPFADIRTPVSSHDRGGESAKDRILRRSGTPRGRLGVVR